MKRILLIASVLLAAIAVSCKKETPVEDSLTLKSQASVTVPVDGDVVSIAFNTNVAWTAKASQDWVTLQPASGEAGDATVKASVVKNEAFDAREAQVTITAGSKTATVTILQGQTNALQLETTSFEVPAEGGNVEVKVKANVNYEVKIPAAVDWITQTKGLTESTVTLTVAPSSSTEVRTANITITDGTLSSGITISQAAFQPYFDYTGDWAELQWSFYGTPTVIPQEGADIVIGVDTNIEEWRAYFSVWDNDQGAMVDSWDIGWAHLSYDVDKAEIHLVIDANETYVERVNYLYAECTLNGQVSGEYGGLGQFNQPGLTPKAGASVVWTKLLPDMGIPAGYNRLAYKTAGGDALLVSDGDMIHVVNPANGDYWKSIEWTTVRPVSICSDESGNIIASPDIPFEPGSTYSIFWTANVNEEPVPLFTHTADFNGTLGSIRVRGDLGSRAVVTAFISENRYWAGWEIDNFAVSYDNYYNVDGQTRGPIAVDADAWTPEAGAAMSAGPRLNEGVFYRAYDTAQSLFYLKDAYTPAWVCAMEGRPYDWKLVCDAGAGGDENQNNMDIIDYQGHRIMAYTQGMQWNYVTNGDVYFIDVTNPEDPEVIAILDTWDQACVEEIAIGVDYGWGCSAAYTSADVKLHIDEELGLVCYVVNSTMESLTKVLITF